MNSDPKRLTVVGATDLERSLLHAARRERPSPELTARMAAGLGISVGLAASAASAPAAAAAPAAVGKVTAVGAWVAAGVLVVAAGAGVVGARMYGAKHGGPVAERTPPAVVASPAANQTAVDPGSASSRAAARSEKRAERVRRRQVVAGPSAAPAADLRDQIALIDAARTAVRSGATDRALVLLRRYDGSYPTGAFRPEALALRIEALDQAGRGAEAQALAREFLARFPQSPSADRVARVARQ